MSSLSQFFGGAGGSGVPKLQPVAGWNNGLIPRTVGGADNATAFAKQLDGWRFKTNLHDLNISDNVWYTVLQINGAGVFHGAVFLLPQNNSNSYALHVKLDGGSSAAAERHSGAGSLAIETLYLGKNDESDAVFLPKGFFRFENSLQLTIFKQGGSNNYNFIIGCDYSLDA